MPSGLCCFEMRQVVVFGLFFNVLKFLSSVFCYPSDFKVSLKSQP